MINLILALGVLSNPCSSNGMVCMYQTDSCAIYSIRRDQQRRVRVECEGVPVEELVEEDARDFTFANYGVQFSDGLGSVRIIHANFQSESRMMAAWAGELDNLFVVAGVDDELAFVTAARESICEAEISVSHRSKECCQSEPLYLFVGNGQVGALKGKYWLNADGSLKRSK